MKVLIITGTMGSGKTTVMAEASDVLIERSIVHAALDLDARGIGHVPPQGTPYGEQRSDGMPHQLESVMFRNLRAVWRNYAAVGADRLLIAAAMEKRDLSMLREALDYPEITICRLRASLGVMQERVRIREPGMFQERGVKRVGELDALLDAAGIEDFSAVNDGQRSVTEVAVEMLTKAGWL